MYGCRTLCFSFKLNESLSLKVCDRYFSLNLFFFLVFRSRSDSFWDGLQTELPFSLNSLRNSFLVITQRIPSMRPEVVVIHIRISTNFYHLDLMLLLEVADSTDSRSA